jgi:hypothetical protein
MTAGKDVNIKDGTNNYYETLKSTTNGFDSNYKLTVGSSSSTTEATISKGSTIGGATGLNIKSNNDVNIQGSTVVGGENGIKIAAEKNINLTDGKNEIKNKSHSETYDVISYQRRDSQSETNESIGNEIISKGNVEISSNENIASIGTNIVTEGNTNITAKNNADFKAGKNTHNEKNSSIGVGIVSGGVNLGAGGYSVESSWTPTDGTDSKIVGGKASDQTIDDMTKTGKFGKNYMDSLAKLGTEMGISIKNESEKSTTWTEGDIKSKGDINIKTGGTTDIGGVNLESDKTINVHAKQVDTTKYVDEHEEKSSNIGVTVKLDNMTTSAVADAVNKGMQISEGAKGQDGGLNPALTAAQVGGTAANLVFGDLIANTTALTGNISYGQSESKTTEENTTNIKAKDNVNITATNGDINLKGVEIEADKEVSLNTTGNINLEAAKKTEKEKSFGINASAGVTTTGGVSTLDGANTQLGITGSGSYSETSKNNTYYKGTSIKSGGKTTINSGKDTNLIGSTIAGETVDIKADGNLNIETKKDKINEHRKEGWGGLDVSAGLATNTIFTGDLGVSAGGGDIWKNGDKINEQAGITAKKDINAEIKGDANIKGGILGSETGKGNLKVAGDLNISDIHSNYEEGGAIVGINGGTKGGGILGEVGDRVDLEKTANGTIAINKEKIKVDKDIIVNNNKVDIGNINNDSNKALTTDKDEKENGGTFSATASARPIKKKQKGSYDIDNDEVDGKRAIVREHEVKFEKAEIEKGPEIKRAVLKTEEGKEKFVKAVIKDKPIIRERVKNLPENEVKFAEAKVEKGPELKRAIVKTQKPERGPVKEVLVKEGYIKTEEGKWIKLNGERGEQGVVTTQGPFTPEGLKGFKAGVRNGNGFVKGEIKEGPGVKKAVKKTQGDNDKFVDVEIEKGPGVKQAVKKTQEDNDKFVEGKIEAGIAKRAGKVKNTQPKETSDVVDGYKKGPDGRWYPTKTSKGQGAALTNGLSYKGVKGFQKGVKDLADKSKVVESPNINHVRDENGTFHKVKFIPSNDGATYVKDDKGTYHRVEKVENGDKYSLLDKDNAFDLPKDDGIRATFKDTVGETLIKKEHYEPLYGEPPQEVLKKTGNKNKELPPLPPVDYNTGDKDKLPPLPPVDYNTRDSDRLPPLPPVDYIQSGGGDKLPPLPPIDYNTGKGLGKKQNKKRVNFTDEEPEIGYVPKEDSTRKPYDNNRDSDDISEDIEGLIKEQNSFTEKLNSGKKLSKSERERIKEIEKEMRNLKDELNDAIGRDKADRPDDERIPDELSSLFREQQKLADKLNKGQKLQKEERNRLEEIENELRTLINTIHNGNIGGRERLAPPAATPVTKVVSRVPSISDNRIESPKVTLNGEKIKPPVPPKPSKNKNIKKSEEEIVYADLKDLGNGSGMIIGKGNETIYSEIKTSGKDNPPPLPPKKKIGKKVEEEIPMPPKREESLVVDTSRKIENLMKRQEELTSKGELTTKETKELDKIEKDLIKEMAQLQKDLGDKGPEVPLREKSLNK